MGGRLQVSALPPSVVWTETTERGAEARARGMMARQEANKRGSQIQDLRKD